MKVKKYPKNEKVLNDLLKMNYTSKIGVLQDPDATNTTRRAIKAQADKKVRNDENRIVTTTDIDVLDVAIIHEFGAPDANIPERSFLRSTADDKAVQRYMVKVARKTLETETDPMKIMKLLSVALVGRVKLRFTRNNWDSLKDPTRGGKNFKGTAKPLIDTGQLRASIAYQVLKGDKL